MENNYKTIVYLTVNTQNDKIYIGVHDTYNPDVFDGYIGNGVNIYHPHTIKHPSCPFQYAVKKYGFKAFKRYILCVCETREEALNIERTLVNEDFIKRDSNYNITLGGGTPPIFEKRVYQYSLNGDFIKEHLSITDAERSVGLSSGIGSAIKYKTVSGGYLWSDTKVDKLNLKEYNVVCQNKPIYVYNNDKKFIEEYPTIASFCKKYKVTLGPVQRAIITKTKVRGVYVSDKKNELFIKEKTIKKISKIYQYTLSGDFVAEYNSGLEAYKKLGKGYSQIISKLKRGFSVCGDYQWSFEKLKSMGNVTKYCAARKVGQFDLNGNLVKIYNTVRECRKDFGNVSRVLSGKCKQCKNYTFKYI